MDHPRSGLAAASPSRGQHQRTGAAGSAVFARASGAPAVTGVVRRKRFDWALAIRASAAWIVTLLLVFPIVFLAMTAFKTELQAIHVPTLWFFTPTLENFHEVQERSNYLLFAQNSIITSVGSTLLGLAIAAPAAYSMAFFRTRHTRDILMWMLSTKMMPAVGALVPVYVLAQKSALLDTTLGLIIVFTLSNLPIMVWMLYSHFKDIPPEILEAARMDGAGVWGEFRHVLLPLGMGGLASTGLLCLVLSWNEAFWSLNLSAANAGTLAALIASYSSPEGLFWAKLSAASLLAIAPIVVFGWFSQKQLVQGLTFGAVK
jgi:sorbitol/mannitol transport system permease protein